MAWGMGECSSKDSLRSLSGWGVRVLVDVRLHAMSRKPGFSKCRFVAALEGAGIRYVHDPRLGNAKEDRVSFRRGGGREGRAVMCARLLNGRRVALREFQDGG